MEWWIKPFWSGWGLWSHWNSLRNTTTALSAVAIQLCNIFWYDVKYFLMQTPVTSRGDRSSIGQLPTAACSWHQNFVMIYADFLKYICMNIFYSCYIMPLYCPNYCPNSTIKPELEPVYIMNDTDLLSAFRTLTKVLIPAHYDWIQHHYDL